MASPDISSALRASGPDPAEAPPLRPRAPPVCELGGIRVYAVRLAEEPEFVQRITQLRAMAFGGGGPWNYGLDLQDHLAIQMVAFDESGPVGALRVCLGDELLARDGLRAFYVNTGWEFEPQAEDFFGTAMEYGRFWGIRGHPRTQGIRNALLASLAAYARAHPRYQSVFGTMALLDPAPEASQLIASYLRRHHLPVKRRLSPRRALPADAGPALRAPPEMPRTKAFRALVHRLREVDPEHPLPALLHLYLRQGAELLGDVTLDTTGRKLLVPLFVTMATFQGFAQRLHASVAQAEPATAPTDFD